MNKNSLTKQLDTLKKKRIEDLHNHRQTIKFIAEAAVMLGSHEQLSKNKQQWSMDIYTPLGERVVIEFTSQIVGFLYEKTISHLDVYIEHGKTTAYVVNFTEDNLDDDDYSADIFDAKGRLIRTGNFYVPGNWETSVALLVADAQGKKIDYENSRLQKEIDFLNGLLKIGHNL